MDFTLHQLRIFVEVAKHESVTKAAEEMYMTQPALSMQLKNLQSQFDLPLFEKIGKRIYITDFGITIADKAMKVLEEAEALQFMSKEYKGKLTGKLRISAASTGKYLVPSFLTEFIGLHPGIDLKLDVSNKTKVIKNVKDNEVDFALVSVVPERLNTEEELLIENRLYMVGSKKSIPEDHALIYREEGSATRLSMEQFMGTPNKRKSMVLTSNEAVKQAVIAGLGYSILPLIGIRNEVNNKQLYIVPYKGLPITTFWRFIWLKDKKLSPVAQAYLDYIREEKERIIKKHFKWYLNLKL